MEAPPYHKLSDPFDSVILVGEMVIQQNRAHNAVHVKDELALIFDVKIRMYGHEHKTGIHDLHNLTCTR